jgi:hypothetical protein
VERNSTYAELDQAQEALGLAVAVLILARWAGLAGYIKVSLLAQSCLKSWSSLPPHGVQEDFLPLGQHALGWVVRARRALSTAATDMLLSTGAAETMALVAARRAMMLNCMFAVLVGYPKGWIEVIEDCWWSGLEDWMDELMILSTTRADERRYIHVWAGLRSPSSLGHSFAEFPRPSDCGERCRMAPDGQTSNAKL